MNSAIVKWWNSQVFWSKKRSSESCNLEREVAQNSGFVQVVVCPQRVGTMFQGAQSIAFAPSLQCFDTLVTLSWEGRNIELWGVTLRVILQNWHLHILSNRPLKAKRLTINGLLKAQIFAIFRPIENLFSNMRFSWGSLSRKFISNHVQGEQTWLEGGFVIPRFSLDCLYFRPNSVNLPKFVVLYKFFRNIAVKIANLLRLGMKKERVLFVLRSTFRNFR